MLSKLESYCLPRSSEDFRNKPNYITNNTTLTIKDKCNEKKSITGFALDTESDSTATPKYTLELEDKTFNPSIVGDKYFSNTSDQSTGPGLPTQMHICTIDVIH